MICIGEILFASRSRPTRQAVSKEQAWLATITQITVTMMKKVMVREVQAATMTQSRAQTPQLIAKIPLCRAHKWPQKAPRTLAKLRRESKSQGLQLMHELISNSNSKVKKVHNCQEPEYKMDKL